MNNDFSHRHDGLAPNTFNSRVFGTKQASATKSPGFSARPEAMSCTNCFGVSPSVTHINEGNRDSRVEKPQMRPHAVEIGGLGFAWAVRRLRLPRFFCASSIPERDGVHSRRTEVQGLRWPSDVWLSVRLTCFNERQQNATCQNRTSLASKRLATYA